MVEKQTCVIVDAHVFQDAINELFGVDELDIPNYRIEDEVNSPFYGMCGYVKIEPEHQDWNYGETMLQDFIDSIAIHPQKITNDEVGKWMKIEANVMATLICRGVIPEDVDLYLVDFDWM